MSTIGTAQVGPAGGTLVSSDGRFTLVVPPGALDTDVTLSVTTRDERAPGAVGPTYEIAPTGTRFATPAALLLAYDPSVLSDADGAHVSVATERAAGDWSPLEVSATDHGRAVALLHHLSSYAAVALPSDSAPSCACATQCFTAACSRTGGATTLATPSKCSCRLPLIVGGADPDPDATSYARMWALDDAYTACAGRALYARACTPCIKRCLREHQGYVVAATDAACDAAFDDPAGDTDGPNANAGLRCADACNDPISTCGDDARAADAGTIAPDAGHLADAATATVVATLASGLARPATDLAVDDTNVYWTDGDLDNDTSGAVMKMPLTGGPAVTLDSLSGPSNPSKIAIDRTNVYWIYESQGTVMKVPIAGGSSSVLASGSPGVVGGLGVGGGYVYYSVPSALMRVATAGGSPSLLAANQRNVESVVVDTRNVYWVDFETPGGVMRLSLSDGAVVTIASTQYEPCEVRVDSQRAYWTTYDSVLSAPLQGMAPATVLASGLQDICELVIDATAVYFRTGSGISKVPLGGGAVTPVVQASNVQALAVDATSLYFASSDGTIRKVTPK